MCVWWNVNVKVCSQTDASTCVLVYMCVHFTVCVNLLQKRQVSSQTMCTTLSAMSHKQLNARLTPATHPWYRHRPRSPCKQTQLTSLWRTLLACSISMLRCNSWWHVHMYIHYAYKESRDIHYVLWWNRIHALSLATVAVITRHGLLEVQQCIQYYWIVHRHEAIVHVCSACALEC